MSKQLGDAGEWYALSQFGFRGIPAAKMPDNWTAYDLVLDYGKLWKVSVKTRTKSEKWASAPWFSFNSKLSCDLFVFILRDGSHTNSWIVPFDAAVEFSHKASDGSKIAGTCDLYLKALESELREYLEFWELPTRLIERFTAVPMQPRDAP